MNFLMPPRDCIHDLRHTCASWLYNNGAGLDGVVKWLGHKDPCTTQRYAHANDDFLQDVMSAHRRR
jgi:site-specific recombinase XerD